MYQPNHFVPLLTQYPSIEVCSKKKQLSVLSVYFWAKQKRKRKSSAEKIKLDLGDNRLIVTSREEESMVGWSDQFLKSDSRTTTSYGTYSKVQYTRYKSGSDFWSVCCDIFRYSLLGVTILRYFDNLHSVNICRKKVFLSLKELEFDGNTDSAKIEEIILDES